MPNRLLIFTAVSRGKITHFKGAFTLRTAPYVAVRSVNAH